MRAWRGLPEFEGRSSLRSWLYKIATNACLDLIERRPKRVLPIDYDGAADPHDGSACRRSSRSGSSPPGRPGLEDGYASPARATSCARASSWRSSRRSSTCPRTSARC